MSGVPGEELGLPGQIALWECQHRSYRPTNTEGFSVLTAGAFQLNISPGNVPIFTFRLANFNHRAHFYGYLTYSEGRNTDEK